MLQNKKLTLDTLPKSSNIMEAKRRLDVFDSILSGIEYDIKRKRESLERSKESAESRFSEIKECEEEYSEEDVAGSWQIEEYTRDKNALAIMESVYKELEKMALSGK